LQNQKQQKILWQFLNRQHRHRHHPHTHQNLNRHRHRHLQQLNIQLWGLSKQAKCWPQQLASVEYVSTFLNSLAFFIRSGIGL
jgi:hypothetical protein